MEFQITDTLDGSPTLRLLQNGTWTETMHSPKGALSETLYIYHGAMLAALERGWPLRVLSLGLGLGYNEMVYAATCARMNLQKLAKSYLSSFEAIQDLNVSFLNWVLNRPTEGQQQLTAVYDRIARMIHEQLKVPAEAIKVVLRDLFITGQWNLNGAFGPHTDNDRTYNCILFDAFSTKTSPDLWTDETLAATLDRLCEPGCVFSTYAATGRLTRHLESRGFADPKRAGFSGKRESTFAIREPAPATV